MHEREEQAFLLELAKQLRGADRAFSAVLQAVARGNGSEFFEHASHFLNHVGIVSRILRPGGPEDGPMRARGRALRARLGIADDEPALDRGLRDRLEHIDEHLNEWVKKDGSLIDRMVFDPRAILSAGQVDENLPVRHYNVMIGRFTVLGREFDLRQLVKSLARIRAAVSMRFAELGLPDQC